MENLPILYAEDDENDVFLMKRAFRLAGVPNELRVVNNGQEAIEYLSPEGSFRDRTAHPLPALVILDLKMPIQTGLDVLKWMRSQPSTASIPALMLTSSNQDKDIHRAYILGANGYLIKPGNPNELLTMVKSIKDYWLSQNQMPQNFPGIKPPQA